MKIIRWGILGCGDVTELKSGPGFQKASGSALVAVMRRTPGLARDYAQRHGVPHWYQDADQLLADPEVDAVYVATPPSSHCELAVRAARAGKPVYVEKPMALNSAECDLMIAACQKAGVPLFVAYYRRRLERFVKLKQWIDSGVLGQIRLVTVTQHQPPTPAELSGTDLPWRVRPELSGGGKFLDVGCHTLDLLDFLLGPIETASGSSANQAGLYPADDVVNAHFTFRSGVKGIGLWCFSAFSALDANRIVGSAGSVEFSTFGDGPLRLTTERGTELFEVPTPPHIQQPLIQSIVDELGGKGLCPSTGLSGARTTRVMQQIYG